MSTYKIQVVEIKERTHDTFSFVTTKPKDYQFKPGQATELSILKEGWEDEKRPFTFTSLPGGEHLEFTIKTYPSHEGVTNELRKVKTGDSFEIGDAWGAIEYKGKGVFLAGGAGITPFIAILRHLQREDNLAGHKLIFANKSPEDIILKDELHTLLGENFINILDDNGNTDHPEGRIDKDFLKKHISDFDQHFYVCGPDKFNEAMIGYLKELGANAESVVFEE
ncbi:flavodoxin reductase [Hyphobacterium sp. CCMP332]|nr:flavodoxin reductase [Hyphobacterium sp. CCMP332]